MLLIDFLLIAGELFLRFCNEKILILYSIKLNIQCFWKVFFSYTIKRDKTSMLNKYQSLLKDVTLSLCAPDDRSYMESFVVRPLSWSQMPALGF